MAKEIYTIIKNSKARMKCPVCGKFSYIFKKVDSELMCDKCFSKNPILSNFDKNIELVKQNPSKNKLSKEQIEVLKANREKYLKSLGKIKILYGGCFK